MNLILINYYYYYLIFKTKEQIAKLTIIEYIYINRIRQDEFLKHIIQQKIYFYPKQIKFNPFFCIIYSTRKFFWIKPGYKIFFSIYI